MQLFLENPVFILPAKIQNSPYPKVRTMLINEMFCLDIMRSVLSVWSGKNLDMAGFEAYKASFLKLLSEYKERNGIYKNELFSTSSLAHIVYFIESYFCVAR